MQYNFVFFVCLFFDVFFQSTITFHTKWTSLQTCPNASELHIIYAFLLVILKCVLCSFTFSDEFFPPFQAPIDFHLFHCDKKNTRLLKLDWLVYFTTVLINSAVWILVNLLLHGNAVKLQIDLKVWKENKQKYTDFFPHVICLIICWLHRFIFDSLLTSWPPVNW